MPKDEPKIACHTPTPGKKPTRIPKWKYDLLHTAILKVVPANDDGIVFKTLPDLVAAQLSDEERESLGSIGWHTTTVKLDMEVKGDIERIPDVVPQRLRRPR